MCKRCGTETLDSWRTRGRWGSNRKCRLTLISGHVAWNYVWSPSQTHLPLQMKRIFFFFYPHLWTVSFEWVTAQPSPHWLWAYIHMHSIKANVVRADQFLVKVSPTLQDNAKTYKIMQENILEWQIHKATGAPPLASLNSIHLQAQTQTSSDALQAKPSLDTHSVKGSQQAALRNGGKGYKATNPYLTELNLIFSTNNQTNKKTHQGSQGRRPVIL